MKKIHIISLRVIALFVIAILVSFIPDYSHEFFGDWLCEGSKFGKFMPETGASYSHYERIGCDVGGKHNSTWHWGYRHWLFFAMGAVLFIIQSFDIIDYV